MSDDKAAVRFWQANPELRERLARPKDRYSWWSYSQNNSGGCYRGPHAVWVQARSVERANLEAELEAGIYFDGVDRDIDCACCGDRWSQPWRPEKDVVADVSMSLNSYLTHEVDLAFLFLFADDDPVKVTHGLREAP